MGQQLLKQAVGQRRQPFQHIMQISSRVVPVQARRLHQAHHDGRALAGEFAAHELPCFATHRPWLDLALHPLRVLSLRKTRGVSA
jgi:hypothetical protein